MRTTVYDRNTRTKTVKEFEELIDPETGEVVLATIENSVRYGNWFLRLNVAMYQEAVMSLNLSSIKVLAYMMGNCSHATNICEVTQKELAQYIDTSCGTIERATSQLQDLDYVRVYKFGRWMINPLLAVGCKEERRQQLIDVYFSLPRREESNRSRKKKGETEDVTESTF